MKLGNIFRGPKWPRDAAEFIATHFADKSVTECFDEPRFERFLYLAKTETWVEAAREYRDVTGEDIHYCCRGGPPDVPVSESVG